MKKFRSPTEPPADFQDFESSSECEKIGADYMATWSNEGKDSVAAVQRKTVPDFVNSIHDGRIYRCLTDMSPADYRMLLIEDGPPSFSSNGNYVGRGKMSIDTYEGLLLWAQVSCGCFIAHSTRQRTRRTIDNFFSFCYGVTCSGVGDPPRARPAAKLDPRSHFIQGLPGVGPGLAKSILKSFGGLPFECPDMDKLALVPGMGQARLERIRRFFR